MRSTSTLTRPAALGLGAGVLWFSILVLIPLTLIIITSVSGGWDNFWATLSNAQTAAAIWLTVKQALLVTVINVVVGTVIAWVLVRDHFFGKALLELVIDIPFALPTIVAGLVLLSLYGPNSPVGINVANTRHSVFLALLFVTLPFVVRTVEPVLIEMDRDVEQAAASLGASKFTILRRIVLPSLAPAIAAGATPCARCRRWTRAACTTSGWAAARSRRPSPSGSERPNSRVCASASPFDPDGESSPRACPP